MTEKELNYIKTITEEKSISKAARKLFISQPSLSQYVRRIETELGTELFKRTPAGLIPTYAGEQYYRTALKILALYEDLEREGRLLLEDKGCDEKGLTAFEKLRTYLMIDLQTLTDRSASHVAEMMMIGSNMGVINAVKNLKKYPEGDKQVRALMERLLRFEEDNIQQLKKFL